MNKFDLDTPALLLDRDKLERNIRRMADWARRNHVAVRPHFKVHRTPQISQMQMEAGAIGITCAKLGEAEVLIEHGILDILIAYEIVGPKIPRLCDLAARSRLIALVDNPEVVRAIAAAARERGVVIDLLVDVDVGMARCGVQSVPEAIALGRLIAQEEGLRLRGLAAYEGHFGHLPPSPEKTQKIRACLEPLAEIQAAWAAEGIETDIISAAGTGTFYDSGPLPFLTEIQAGTYAMNDLLYHGAGSDFEFAMTVLALVVSRRPGTLICDAGMKALHPAFGPSQPLGHPELHPRGLSAEHGAYDVEGETDLQVGDKFEIIPYYADGTINLFTQWHVVRGDEFVEIWPIAAHGRSQ